MQKQRGAWVIASSFIVAFFLAVLPFPDWLTAWQPAWPLMVLIYWCMALPQRIGVGMGWIMGFIHDLLADTLLGQHALSYALAAYITTSNYHTMRVFPLHQQAFGVFAIVLVSELPGIWARGMMGYGLPDWTLLYRALTSMLLWYWVFPLLRRLRRYYQVSG